MPKLSFYKRIATETFAIGLALTCLASIYVYQLVVERDEFRFDTLSKQYRDELISKVNIITYGLSAANGVFSASKSVEHAEWIEYVASRKLETEFPGVFGFGYIEYVKRDQLDDFIKKTRSDNQPDFQIQTTGNNSDLYVIKFLAPEPLNRAAIGYDIGSEQIRREAADMSMVSGMPTITKRIQLVQDVKQQAGFLFLKPVYSRGLKLDTLDQRRNAIQGWVFAPFSLDDIVSSLNHKYGELLSVSIFQGVRAEADSLLFGNSWGVIDSSNSTSLSIIVGNQPWTLLVKPTTNFLNLHSSRYLPVAIGVIGSLLSLILAVALWSALGRKYLALSSKLGESERFVHGILRSANVSIIVTDPNGIIQVFNDSATRMLLYSSEEMIGKGTLLVIHDPLEINAYALELSDRLGRKIDPGFEVFATGSQANLLNEKEWTYIRKDGSRFPVSLSVTAMRDASGEIVAFMGIASDISDRRAKEREVIAKTQELQDQKNALDEACIVAVTDVSGKITYVNDKFCEISKYSKEELLGQDHRIIKSGYHTDEFMRDMWRTIANGKVWKGEVRNKDKDGKYYWVDSTIVPFLNEKGKPTQYVTIRKDITVQKIYEQVLLDQSNDLSLAKEAAVAAAQAKSQFLANMSHEIRTPLTGIIGYSESLITDSLSSDEQRFALNTIIRNGNHLLGVINDILDLSKIEAGKLDVEILEVNLAELLNDVANLMVHKAQEKGLTFGFEYIFPIPRVIQTDPIRLKQILINLVGNAVKFTLVGSVKINVIYLEKEEKIQFAVVDTGSGLTQEEKGKLFQAFSQADTSITRKFGGTGLGLVISKQLAQKLGGDISIESESGRGSTFAVTISTGPVQVEDLTFALSNSNTDEVPSRVIIPDKLIGKVLVAEDGEDNRGLISFLLKKVGVDFTIVENGAIAVEEATKHNFDLVLMDIQMPVMDGYTATRKLRELGLTLPIVALTANAMKADLDLARMSGCSDYLGKPFTRAQLFSKLGQYLVKVSESESPVRRAGVSGKTLSLIEEVPEMLDVILGIIRGLPKRLEAIIGSVNAGDMEKASLLSHSLRGATGNIGLVELSDVFEIVENAATRNDSVTIEGQFDRLRCLIEDAQKFTQELKMEPL